MATADARLGNAPGGVPDDTALPGAVLLRQPRRLVEALAPLLAEWLDADARLVDSHVAIRRYVPGKRCLFELELVLASGGADAAVVRTVMGKLYAGQEGAQAFATLQRLWASGFGNGPLTVSRPITYDPHWQILLTDQARGVVLRQLLLPQSGGGRRKAEVGRPSSASRPPTSASLGAAVERSAEWLVKLHTSGVTDGRRYTFDRHLHTLALWQGRLVDVCPETKTLLAAVLARIEARGRALSAWEAAPTHRDFSPDNVVLDGTQLSAVDFDEFCQYDPLFDVAHFVAHLRLLGLTSSPGGSRGPASFSVSRLPSSASSGMVQRFDELATRFQMAYEAQAKEYSAARVRLYEAITYLKLAHITACITRPRDWQQLVATLLRLSARRAD